jgi:hypothetical protein
VPSHCMWRASTAPDRSSIGPLVTGSSVARQAAFAARVGWLILPVTVAGLAHVVVLKANLLQPLAIPLDGGRRWRARPLLGSNKTWRGVLLMSAFTAVFTRLQSAIGQQKRTTVLSVSHDYRLNPWLAGMMMGLSYCLAELPNSFIKRQLGVPPGARSSGAPRTQYIIDQSDSVIGCVVALRLYYRTRPGETTLAFVLGFTLHVLIDRLLYGIGVKQRDG